MKEISELNQKSLPYIYGYLVATLGSARDLQPENYRNRIAYLISIIEGDPDPTLVAVEPPIPGIEEFNAQV